MNSDILKGKWKQLRGEIQNKWGKLTNDDLDRVEGNQDKMLGMLQERYGYAKDEARRQLDAFLDSGTSARSYR